MNPFAFYQEVRLARPQPHNAHLAGRTGVILGIGREPGQPVCYGLTIEGEDQIVTCEESELEATGRQFRREDFYDDRRKFRVRVDRDGRGHLA
ncbi:MAG: immunity protein 31 [Opitutae bacterium]|nr:immunity protein 31 [Opitutae bacterium]